MAASSAVQAQSVSARLRDPAYQGFVVLWIAFSVAPVLFGLDKFFHVLVDWSDYLAPQVDRLIPFSADQIMMGVGAIEILAGVLVAFRPQIFAYLVAAWLAVIITDLLVLGDYYDIALRDFGLFLGALALARLARGFRGPGRAPQRQPAPASAAPERAPTAGSHEQLESQWKSNRNLRSR